MGLVSELRRRNVFRMAVLYAIAAWLIMQVATVLIDLGSLPEWIGPIILPLLAIGFPIALIFSWFYEITPEGISLEKDVDRAESITHITGRRMDFIVISMLSAAVLLFAWHTWWPSTPMDKSIAVLPFVNISSDKEQEYFSDGITEEILNALAAVNGLKVAGRTSSFAFKGHNQDLRQIGNILGVEHILEGSVRKSGTTVRITTQLVQVEDGFHLWSETFDRTLGDVFAIQDEIASAVVDALKITLLDAMPTKEVTDADVYALYLQGRYFLSLRGRENLEESVSAFRQALAIDPDYAPAWVGISATYSYQTRFGWLSWEKGSTLAMEAVKRALAIDNNMASAWATLAYLKKTYEWDWEGASAAVDKALQLEPNNVHAVGVAASLAGNLGQTSAATVLHERAVALDPLNATGLSALGQDYMRNGRLDEAIEVFSRLVALKPGHGSGNSNLGRAYFLKGDVERALLEIDKSPFEALKIFEKIQIHFILGNHEEAQVLVNEYLEKYSRHDPVRTAALYASLGDNDMAFEWLETAFLQRDSGLAWFLVNVHLRNLESDPRYPVFLEKLGLLEAWKAMSLE